MQTEIFQEFLINQYLNQFKNMFADKTYSGVYLQSTQHMICN